MQFAALTDRGLEPVTMLEVKEIAGAKGKKIENAILFEADLKKAFEFCYKAQSIDRLLMHPVMFPFSGFEDLLEKAAQHITDDVFKEWMLKDTFRVECEREGSHDFSSNDAGQEIGSVIFEKAKALGRDLKVDLKRPPVVIHVRIIDDDAVIGLDLAGRDLSKRQYRIFTAPGIVNSKLAYAMVRFSGYNKKQVFLDLNCRSGIIPIEASFLTTGISVNKYSKDFAFMKLYDDEWPEFFAKIDSQAKPEKHPIMGLDPLLRNLEASKKNAKLAGVDKLISFSKMDMEWLDTKLEENSVDLVVSRVVVPGSHLSENSARKIYKELFWQCEFFVRKGGQMLFLGENLLILKEMVSDKFKLVKEDDIWSGKQRYEYAIIERV